MKNFSIETSIHYEGQSVNNTPTANYYTTNNVLEFSQQIASSVEYFTNMVRYNETIICVSMLIRCYKDHHVISIEGTEDGTVKVTTNQ